MSRLLRVLTALFALVFAVDAFAAGYSCPTYKKYTSCASGYYMTKGGTYNGTPVAGNACTSCPSGYTCAGGTADKKISTVTCSAGQYINGTTCKTCEAGYRCNGQTTYTPNGARRVPVQQNTKIQLGKPAARPSAPVIINPATPPRPSVRRDIRWVPVRPIKIHVSETLPRPGPRLPRQPSQLIVRRLPHRAAVHREHAHIKRIMRVP